MFKFSELESIHLEISNNCQASCPLCPRNRNGTRENPLINRSDWTLSDFQKIISVDVLNQIKVLVFCGNFGDPMMNNDVLDMIEYSTNINHNLDIVFHTNGSLRQTDWWVKLAKVLPKKHNVVFALDGLEDTHHLYRIGTNYNHIIKNARAFIDAGGRAEWCFIRFKHNQHQLEEAKLRAKNLGFAQFTFKNSSRFVLEPRQQIIDNNGNNLYYVESATDSPINFVSKKVIDNIQDYVENSVIDCQAKKNKEIYIDAFGNLAPCCYIASIPFMYVENDYLANIKQKIINQYYKLIEDIGDINKLNTIQLSVKDIIESDYYQNIWNKYWSGSNKLITCVRTCGKGLVDEFGKTKDQLSPIIKL